MADSRQETNNLANKIDAHILNQLKIVNFSLNKENNKGVIFNIENIKMFL